MKKLFTSESVTEGHPDKVADRIADSILDEALKIDPESRVACETSVTTGLCFIYGEITTKANLKIEEIARKSIKESGYDDSKFGYDSDNVAVLVAVDRQSPDIALGVDKTANKEQGAGDQGIMFGFASDETKEFMPMPISLAHKLSYQLTKVRKDKTIPYLRPDGKTQVTVEYDENDIPIRIDTIVVSSQHDPEVKLEDLKKDILKEVIEKVIPNNLIDENTKYLINPTGRFVIGGPKGDSGLTGRKLIVDTYGGYSRHGGGAFSGKDASKVDRSASYMARYLAKNIVASKIAKKCEIQLAYAIGVAKPVSIYIDTFNTSSVDEKKIVDIILKNFDLTPEGIINHLKLKSPIFVKTTNYGHFGREDQGFNWEKLDKVDIFKNIKN